MIENIRIDIIALLKDTVKALEMNDIVLVRDLSNNIIHNASIFQDEHSISTAVIIYSLSKIIHRESYVDVRIINILNKAIDHLQKQQIGKYENDIKKLIKQISNTDSKLDLYIQHVMDQAHVKKASKVYEHGISLGQTAYLLGISQWELMKYIGHTKISEEFRDNVTVKSRITFARELFK